MAQNRTDREIIEALLRQMDPQTYPAGAPDLPAQLGAWLEGQGQSLESSLQGESGLERFAELIPRFLAANPAQNVGALLQMRQPEVEQLKTMATQAAAQPVETAKAVGRAGLEAVKDPMGTAEGLSALEALGAGKALSSLAKMGTRLRGPDLIESVMPEAKVERPKTRTERSQELLEESLARGEVPGETGKADLSRQIDDAIRKGDLNMDFVDDATKYDAVMRKLVGFTEFDKLPDIEKARLDRAAQQGFNIDAFHGTKGDISAFDPGLMGSTTGAPSARKGFFFSADPETASAYAREADPVELGRISQDEFDARIKKMRNRQSEASDEVGELEGKIHNMIGIPIIKKGIADLDVELKTWMTAERASPGKGDALLRERELMVDALNEGYEKTEEYADLYFPEYKLLSAEVDVLEGRIDRGEVGHAGDNIMPVKLKLQNPLEHDFSNESYREVSYHDLLEQAQREGRDGAIFRNTYDGGDLTDIYVVFDPSQIRSRYAMFDPEKSASGEVIAGAAPLVLPLGAGAAAEAYMANQEQ